MAHSVFLGTNMANPIHFPSGDHLMLRGPSVSRVTWVVAPSASIQRTKICAPLGSSAAAM